MSKRNDATGYKRGEGPYSSSKLTFERSAATGADKEIYGMIEDAKDVKGGFAGKLPKR